MQGRYVVSPPDSYQENAAKSSAEFFSQDLGEGFWEVFGREYYSYLDCLNNSSYGGRVEYVPFFFDAIGFAGIGKSIVKGAFKSIVTKFGREIVTEVGDDILLHYVDDVAAKEGRNHSGNKL